jgi:hypothetical protein
MGKEPENDILLTKEQLIERVKDLMGYEPPGIRVLLRVLSHPDIVTDTVAYFQPLDKSSACTQYEPPWNCARESEARYENIKYGWLGAGNGVGYSEWWCDPCKKKVMGG